MSEGIGQGPFKEIRIGQNKEASPIVMRDNVLLEGYIRHLNATARGARVLVSSTVKNLEPITEPDSDLPDEFITDGSFEGSRVVYSNVYQRNLTHLTFSKTLAPTYLARHFAPREPDLDTENPDLPGAPERKYAHHIVTSRGMTDIRRAFKGFPGNTIILDYDSESRVFNEMEKWEEIFDAKPRNPS